MDLTLIVVLLVSIASFLQFIKIMILEKKVKLLTEHTKDLWKACDKLIDSDKKIMEGVKATSDLVALMSKYVKYKHE